MTKIKYCCDCDFYIPGGKEHNCTAIHGYNYNTISALKTACTRFKEKTQKEVIVFKQEPFKRRKRKIY